MIHGHGIRTRFVVVPPAIEQGTESIEIVECWERRFRCTRCRAVMVVLPRGVLPRFLYSVAAIIIAFVLVTPEPVGEGASDAEAYARQGMFAALSPYAEDPYRWRSLGRWAALAEQWWSAWTGSISSLLVLFLERAGAGGIPQAVRVAIDHHVRWGSPM